MKKLAVALALLFAGPVLAQTPVADLAKPSADARHYLVVSGAGKHGDSYLWTTPDGVHMNRESIILRGQVFELDSAIRMGGDGMIQQLTIRGFTPNGDAGETFAVADGKASWKSQVDAGSAAYTAPALYSSFGGPIDTSAQFVDALMAAPDKSLALLPGGKVHAEPLISLAIGEGAKKITVSAYALVGLFNTPVSVWVDDKNHFFAQIGALSWIPAGYESADPVLHKAQDEAMAARSPAQVKALLRTPSGAVAFTHVRAFLGGDHFAEDQTVVVEQGKIVAAGPAASVAPPAGAELIDGAGKTLVPGLWDAHMHFPDDASGPFLLSLGMTSARDPGNINALTIARAERRARGELLSPRVYPSVLIDGKGPNSAQSGTVVTSLKEALAAVRKAKAEGFTGIKIYGTFNPAWVKATAAEAHRLGLHVHGHIPAGMRPAQAIKDGYDEVTHINFVMMQAMPDEVVNKSNGIARFQGPGRYAKDVDLNAEPMKGLIATMAKRHITVDATLSVFEGLLVPENGDLSPAYAPYVGTLPPAVERGFRQGGFAPPQGVTRADYRASFAKLKELVGVLHQAGVPIVAGTDGSGLELVRELELYVEAGFTPAEALAAATIVPARLVGAGDRTGSIETGKAADLVLVDGDPSKNIGDLRHTRVVMMDGKIMNADALRAAGGISGKPKYED